MAPISPYFRRIKKRKLPPKGPLPAKLPARVTVTPANSSASTDLQSALNIGKWNKRKKNKPTLTPAQRKLIKSAKPLARAQRSAAQIAAMHAYRASGGGSRDQGPPVSKGADAARLNAMMDKKKKKRKRNRKATTY